MFLDVFFCHLNQLFLKKQILVNYLKYIYKFSFVKKSWSFFLYFMLTLLFSGKFSQKKFNITGNIFFVIFFFFFPKMYLKKYMLSYSKNVELTNSEFFFYLYPDLKYFQKFSLVFKSLIFRF